jgi:hypothetical protein
MDTDELLLTISWIMLVFWSGVLAYCVAVLAYRYQKDKKWEQEYRPTLERDIAEHEVSSFLTLDELEGRKGMGKRRAY